MRYWIVSANVHGQGTARDWVPFILEKHSAFMGWGDDHRLGLLFQDEVKPGDAVLIAYGGLSKPGQRRLVACGRVETRWRGRIESPDGRRPEAAVHLLPFIPLDDDPAKYGIDFAGTPHFGNKQPVAIFELLPGSTKYPGNSALCEWLDRVLAGPVAPPRPDAPQVRTARLSLDCTEVSSYSIVPRDVRAERREQKLVIRYHDWLKSHSRSPETKTYSWPSGTILCDLFEPDRGNLVEAKASADRASVRMAIGQLMDYGFSHEQGSLSRPNLAVLVPELPSEDLVALLHSLDIAIVWPEGEEFRDTMHGRFT